MGAHSDCPRSPGRGDFNGVFCHRLDQGPPPVMPRDFEIGQGHSAPVGNECKACSIGSSTIFPGQGIVHRGDMRPSSLPPPLLARQTRPVEATLHPRSCSFTRSAVVVRISLLRTRQRCDTVAFSTDSSNLDGHEFRSRVRIDSAGASIGAKGIRGVVVLTRKAPVAYYHEGARHRQTRHSALCQRLAWTYGVPLRRQPGSRDDHQEPYVLFPTADERVASLDGIAGTTRHSFVVSIYPQRAQPDRHLFKTDRPRRVDVVALCSAHAHVVRASSVPQEYLARCLRLSTVKSDISLRLQTLRSRGIDRGWTLARLE